MTNLLEETMEVLAEHNKTFDDILWIENGDYEIPKELFMMLADHLYDDGYGAQEVSPGLCMVGDGFFFERAEYDGAEWWEYKECPIRPSEVRYDITFEDIFY